MIKIGCLMMLMFISVLVKAEGEINDVPKSLSVIRGKTAILQCGEQGAVTLDDIVIWYRNDDPIATLIPTESPTEAILILEEVDHVDVGVYRCRINRISGPSKDYVMQLSVIDFHGTPVILNDRNNSRIQADNLGPFKEGEELSLRCEVEDSDPRTHVRWYRNSEPYARAHHAAQGFCCAELMIRNMSRFEHGVLYECVAESQNATKSAGFRVQMTLPPLNVSIRTDNNDDFEAGTPRVLACVVYGCVPSPNVTWYLGDHMLRPNVYKEVNRGNFTVSSLTFVPSLSDNGKDLVCRATNEFIPGVFEDRVTVSVGHRPMCIENGFKTIGAVEGESETLVCVVEAYPEPEQFTWTFADSRTIYTSSKKLSGYDNRYSSTLNWLPRSDDFGPLYCRASNRYGEQKQPCTFSVINGGPPTMPECEMFWENEAKLRVRCEKNWDGGRPQTLHVEVKTAEGTRTVSRRSQEVDIDWLHQGTNVSVEVHASNSRGRSGSVLLILPAMSNPDVLPQNENNPHSRPMAAIVTYVVSSCATIVLVCCLGLTLHVFCKKRAENYPHPKISDGSFHREADLDEATTSATSSGTNKYAAVKKTPCRMAEGNTYIPAPFQNGQCSLMVQYPDCVQDMCGTVNLDLPPREVDTTGLTYYCV